MSLKTGRPSKQANKKEAELSDFTEDSQIEKSRVNFMLETEKYINLKQYALDNRKTVTDVLIEMIDERLAQR